MWQKLSARALLCEKVLFFTNTLCIGQIDFIQVEPWKVSTNEQAN